MLEHEYEIRTAAVKAARAAGMDDVATAVESIALTNFRDTAPAPAKPAAPTGGTYAAGAQRARAAMTKRVGTNWEPQW